jgi:hypothetical protein
MLHHRQSVACMFSEWSQSISESSCDLGIVNDMHDSLDAIWALCSDVSTT